jgi:hypothetical protein
VFAVIVFKKSLQVVFKKNILPYFYFKTTRTKSIFTPCPCTCTCTIQFSHVSGCWELVCFHHVKTRDSFLSGPCGGKTTGQSRLSTFFENLGWKVGLKWSLKIVLKMSLP